MKKQSILLCYLLVAFMALSAQPVVNGIMQGSPRTFMVNPATQTDTSWARPYYGSCSGTETSTPMNDIGGTGSGPGPFATTPGVTTYYTYSSGPGPSHQLKIRTAAQIASNTNPTDPNAIMYPGSIHLPIFPPAFDRDVRPAAFEDTVMQMGHTSGEAKAQRMEYKFIPDTMNPVLMVQFECVLRNGNHDYNQNPSVQILVSGVNDYTPLNLGYYPNDYCGETPPCNGNANLGTASPNDKWPYSRYYFIQDRGCGSFTPLGPYLTPCRWYADNGFTIYTNGGYSDFTSTQYVTVAFNLMEQARTHTPVRLTILMLGCHQSAHCSYIYYTAKMVPGKIDAIACGDVVDFQIPYGFDANSYRWQRGLNADMLEEFTTPSNQYRFSIPADQVMPYYRCTMESQTGVPFTYECYVKLKYPEIDYEYDLAYADDQFTFSFVNTGFVKTVVPGFLNMPPDTTYANMVTKGWYLLENGEETLFSTDQNAVLSRPRTDYRDSITVKMVAIDSASQKEYSVTKVIPYNENAGLEDRISGMQMYPNPADGQFTVASSQTLIKTILIYDLNGKLLQTLTVNGHEASVDIRHLPAATYLARISTENGVVTKTIVNR